MVADGRGAPQPWGAHISAKAANFFELSCEEWSCSGNTLCCNQDTSLYNAHTLPHWSAWNGST